MADYAPLSSGDEEAREGGVEVHGRRSVRVASLDVFRGLSIAVRCSSLHLSLAHFSLWSYAVFHISVRFLRVSLTALVDGGAGNECRPTSRNDNAVI